MKDARFGNVELKIATPESLLLMPSEHDLALFVLGMHDVYYADAKNQWPLIQLNLARTYIDSTQKS